MLRPSSRKATDLHFGQKGMFSSDFFGAEDPFDDPFFKEPIESLFSLHRDLFRPSNERRPFGILRSGPPEERDNKGPVIEESTSLEEQHKTSPIHRSKAFQEPIVEHPDDVVVNTSSQNHSVFGNREWFGNDTCQSCSFSSVSYGGPGGTYYKSSTTRRTGPDGVIEEAHQESDSRAGHEVNRIMRGLGNKGHAVTRKRDMVSGSENFVETLHNLAEEEKSEFDEAWRQHAEKSLPGWNHNTAMLEHGIRGKTQPERRALTSSSSPVAKGSTKSSGSSKNSGWRWPWVKSS